MDNYIAVVFANDREAFAGLHALWKLDGNDGISMHGAAVLHRDHLGNVEVATKHTDPGARTAMGVAIGALLGPIGAAFGASITAGAAAGIGAAAGGVAGLTADALKSNEHQEAAFQSGQVLQNGQSAVLAEVSEASAAPIDTVMARLGGAVYRCPKSQIRKDAFNDDNYADYLYPSDYDPYFHRGPS